MKILIAIFLVLLIGSAIAKEKMKDYCFGNGCLMQTTGWHECKKGELNACRKRATKKPEF